MAPCIQASIGGRGYCFAIGLLVVESVENGIKVFECELEERSGAIRGVACMTKQVRTSTGPALTGIAVSLTGQKTRQKN